MERNFMGKGCYNNRLSFGLLSIGLAPETYLSIKWANILLFSYSLIMSWNPVIIHVSRFFFSFFF